MSLLLQGLFWERRKGWRQMLRQLDVPVLDLENGWAESSRLISLCWER